MVQEKSGVQSIERIFSVVEILAAHPRGAALQTIAAEASLAKSTAHRMLSSLVSLGYALQDGVTGQYRLTLKMFELSSGVVNEMDILSTARPYLERLAARTGEAVHLVIRDGVDIVYLYKAEGGGLRIGSRIGLRNPMYCTGVGKAILSTLSAEEVEQVWKQSRHKACTPHTITRLPELLAQLEQARHRGWAVDDEENELGVRCVALALPGPGGRANAAFSVTSLVPNMSDERMEKLAQTALLARQEILRDMGVATR